ncbi:MAG: sensor domain-containing diguanylate cyclase [Rhodoferax sp.]|nr:sensor domain-containing diguanylate cyclase [Rhodoferax sp.]
MLVVGLICANGLVIVLSVNSLYISRNHYEERAQTLTQNIANALDQNISNTIEKIDLALQFVVDELERQLAGRGLDELAMNEFLARQKERLSAAEGFRVARADGLVILGDGLSKQDRASWANRDYFNFLRENSDNRLQISKPLVGRVSKKYIVGFSRRYNYPDGRFAGVVSAPIEVDYFARILSQFNLGPGGSLILRDDDLGLIARVPAIANKPAGEVGNSAISSEFRKIFEDGTPAATYHAEIGADGYSRIATFRRLTLAPFVVVVAVAKEAYFEGWSTEANRTLAMAGSFLVLSLLLGGFLFRLIGRAKKDGQRVADLQQLLQEQAIRDPLTGLYNRRYLKETLPRELSRAHREGYPLALVLIDLDYFKSVNDTYGHAVGDEVLKTISAIFIQSARESDIVCRYGGEEFLIALPRMSPEQALLRVQAWRIELAQTDIHVGDAMLKVTLSAGIAVYPVHGADTDFLVARADEALYRAKDLGRNCVVCCDV